MDRESLAPDWCATIFDRDRTAAPAPQLHRAHGLGRRTDRPDARIRRRAGLARHAHLPLQSGSDAVLRRMHRRYRPWHYAEKVSALLRAAGPDLTLGADVMVGFPGETDREFEETLAFIRALPFGYLHLFPFSPRPGTRGWALHAASPVAAGAVEERMAALRALAAEKTAPTAAALSAASSPPSRCTRLRQLAAHGRTAALTENFLPVELDGRFPANQLLRCARHRPSFTTARLSGISGPINLFCS